MNFTHIVASAAFAMPILVAADLIRYGIRKRVAARRAAPQPWEDVAERASVELVLETVTAERDRARELAARLEEENARMLHERGRLVAEGLLAPSMGKAETDE